MHYGRLGALNRLLQQRVRVDARLRCLTERVEGVRVLGHERREEAHLLELVHLHGNAVSLAVKEARRRNLLYGRRQRKLLGQFAFARKRFHLQLPQEFQVVIDETASALAALKRDEQLVGVGGADAFGQTELHVLLIFDLHVVVARSELAGAVALLVVDSKVLLQNLRIFRVSDYMDEADALGVDSLGSARQLGRLADDRGLSENCRLDLKRDKHKHEHIDDYSDGASKPRPRRPLPVLSESYRLLKAVKIF